MIIAAAIAAATAVNAGAYTWSLDSCIAYAHANNISVRQRQVEKLNAEYGVTEAKDRFLPTVSAGASQSFDFGRGLTSENTYANRNTSSFGWQAGVNLPIFQGLAGVRRLDYAKVNLAEALLQVEAAKDDITLSIIAKYLQILYSREMLAVNSSQAALSEMELDRRRQLLEAGKIAELDVLEAESQLAADRLSVVNAENDLQLAKVDLMQTLQLVYDPDFDVDSIADGMAPLPSVDEVFGNAMAYNYGMRAANTAIQAAESNVKLSRSGYLPTLSMNASLGGSYYHVGGMDNPSFSRQMRDNFSKSIGFTLSVPIFDAFSTRNNVRRAKASVLAAQLQADDTRTRLYNNIVQAHTRARSAQAKWQAGLVAERAAKAAFEAMQDKYNYGRATATEFEQSKNAWFRSRAELIQARYETLLRARLLAFYNTPR